MKKFAFVLVAMLAMVFTGCKTETSKITVYVEDGMGLPVANCPVFYADYVSIILDAVLPSPEQLVTDMEDCWEYAETNVLGVATINLSMSVSQLTYRFMVYDQSKRDWVYKDVKLRRGINDEISFEINK